MISYEYTDPIKVKLNGKLIGTIQKHGLRYRYVPKAGPKWAGTSFPTIRDVKKSIEGV